MCTVYVINRAVAVDGSCVISDEVGLRGLDGYVSLSLSVRSWWSPSKLSFPFPITQRRKMKKKKTKKSRPLSNQPKALDNYPFLAYGQRHRCFLLPYKMERLRGGGKGGERRGEKPAVLHRLDCSISM